LDRRNLLATLGALGTLPVAVALTGCRGDAAHVLMGMQVPRVRGVTTDGMGVDFAALGRPALVRFWGLWCGPCVQDEPFWREVVAGLRSRADLTILSVHTGEPPRNGPSLAEWVAAEPATSRIPVVDDRTGTITRAFAIPGTPSTLLIGADGRIIEHSWAFKSARGVRAFLRKAEYILDRAAAAVPATAR
jgi:cytochrome c biogenesis protein CcmG, thiol:disulfide interchange protein DsbE